MTGAEAIGSEALSSEALARWRRLRERSGCPTPFSHETVVGAFAKAAGLRVEPVFREVDGLEAGCLLYVRRRGPLAQVVVPPFCFYSAVILPPDAPQETRSRLVRELLSGVHAVCSDANVVLPPAAAPVLHAGLPRPWRHSTFRTYRTAVSQLDRALESWSGGSRRRFAKHADEFEVLADPDQLSAVLTHVSEAYEQHARGLPVERSSLEELIRILHAEGFVDVVALKNRGSSRIDAGMIVIHDDTTAWDWIAGSVRGPGMTVCIGRALERAHELGIGTFDFGGANIEAIATFKRQFGGEEVTYPTFSTPERPLMRWLSTVKRRLAGGG